MASKKLSLYAVRKDLVGPLGVGGYIRVLMTELAEFNMRGPVAALDDKKEEAARQDFRQRVLAIH